MSETSNISHVKAWLNTWVDGFNFKHEIADHSVGRDIAHKAVRQIQDHSLQ
jgi:hypothetical protein